MLYGALKSDLYTIFNTDRDLGLEDGSVYYGGTAKHTASMPHVGFYPEIASR